MRTNRSPAGEATIQVIFALGTDPNQAMINVKTRLDHVFPLSFEALSLPIFLALFVRLSGFWLVSHVYCTWKRYNMYVTIEVSTQSCVKRNFQLIVTVFCQCKFQLLGKISLIKCIAVSQ